MVSARCLALIGCKSSLEESRMDNTDRIKELLREIREAEQTLAGLRAELARLVDEKMCFDFLRHKRLHRKFL